METGLREGGYVTMVDRNTNGGYPSPVTTEFVIREIGHLEEKVNTRNEAYDKAIDLLQHKADKVPSETDLAVARLKELHDTMLKAVERANEKSELLFTKQLDGLDKLLTVKSGANEKDIMDIRTRVDKMEAGREGAARLWALATGALVVIGTIVNLYFSLRGG